MKQIISLPLAVTAFAALLTFSSCSKSSEVATNAPANAENSTSRLAVASFTADDRIDAIVRDLSVDNYSFSFDKPNTEIGITRTGYGTDNYLVFADPQDLICPEPIRKRFPRVPVWKRPQFIVPTCPDMAIDVTKLKEIENLLTKIDINKFENMQHFRASNGATFLATQNTMKTFATLQLDKFDGITEDLNPTKFLLMSAPDLRQGGVFNRSFYGYADLNDIVFKPYKRNLKDLIKPTIKGCFDPIILKTIKERLLRVNPALYRGLEVSSLPENRAIAVLH
jgi:hypothetical protein